jgi:hypothetical protein
MSPAKLDNGIRIPWSAAILFSIAGLVMMVIFWAGAAGQILRGQNDFLAFYAAARLCGTDEIYDAESAAEVQLSQAHATGPAFRVVRPPFHALAVFPLGLLAYQQAYSLWTLLNLCFLVGFVAMWCETNRRILLTACCCSIPIAASFANGQDVPALLFLVGLAFRLFRCRSYFLAGLALSLCAVKFHLFALVPLLLLAQNFWAVALGASFGLACLLGLSFLVCGRSWPMEYWQALGDTAIHPKLSTMPNLHGLTSGISGGGIILFAFSITIAAVCWVIVRRLDFQMAFGVALLGSLLVSYHSYVADAALLIPALLLLAERGTVQKYLALGLLSPIPWFLLLRGGLAANGTRIALILALAAWSWGILRSASASTVSEDAAPAI